MKKKTHIPVFAMILGLLLGQIPCGAADQVYYTVAYDYGLYGSTYNNPNTYKYFTLPGDDKDVTKILKNPKYQNAKNVRLPRMDQWRSALIATRSYLINAQNHNTQSIVLTQRTQDLSYALSGIHWQLWSMNEAGQRRAQAAAASYNAKQQNDINAWTTAAYSATQNLPTGTKRNVAEVPPVDLSAPSAVIYEPKPNMQDYHTCTMHKGIYGYWSNNQFVEASPKSTECISGSCSCERFASKN